MDLFRKQPWATHLKEFERSAVFLMDQPLLAAPGRALDRSKAQSGHGRSVSSPSGACPGGHCRGGVGMTVSVVLASRTFSRCFAICRISRSAVSVTSPPYWGCATMALMGIVLAALGEHLERWLGSSPMFIVLKAMISMVKLRRLNFPRPPGRTIRSRYRRREMMTKPCDKPFSQPSKARSSRRFGHGPGPLAIASGDGVVGPFRNHLGEPNPMPEIVTDRPATAQKGIHVHQGGAVLGTTTKRCAKVLRRHPFRVLAQNIEAQAGSRSRQWRGRKRHHEGRGRAQRTDKHSAAAPPPRSFSCDRWDDGEKVETPAGQWCNLRNQAAAPVPRSRNPTEASGSHFATFPPGWSRDAIAPSRYASGAVLDPFGGSGTTGLVADKFRGWLP